MTRTKDAPLRGAASASADRAVVRRRLEAQLLSATPFTRPADVVAWFGAIQAQDYLGALWAIGLRLTGAVEADVERAVADRAIVRSWPMRGTLHFLAAADARWMMDLLAPRAARAAGGRLRKMGIDAPLLSRARRALVAHLEGGRLLSRPAAYQVLERAGVATEDQRGLHVLWCLAHEGLVCMGPRQGKQHTVALLEEWLPAAKTRPRDQALPELARRYFAAHGPATLRDFAWWSGMTLADARLATDMAGKSVDREIIGGEPHWSSAPPTAAPSSAGGRAKERAAHALPAFDEFFVGYADRSAAIDPDHAPRVRAFDVLGPVILVDGRLAGTWKRRLGAGEVAFSTRLLSPLSRARTAAVERALAGYARFVERGHAFAPGAPRSPRS